jgi:hypothetical protein
MQFSTTAWQYASFETLPSDLTTKASPASPANRVLGKLWVLIVYTSGVGFLIVWSVVVLIWIAIWGPLYPNSSRFPEIDIVARCRIPSSTDRGPGVEDEAALDLEAHVRQNGMGNGTSRDFRARFKDSRLYVGDFRGRVGISTEEGRATRLRSGESY